MSFRLEHGGRLIARDAPVSFRFNGRTLQGFSGDSLASALLANGQMLVGRSFKYHRPRGIVASGAEEPNALVGTGKGGNFEPNQRASLVSLYEGLEARSQNHWPSLHFDLGAINDLLARFLPAGFYYKTFIHPRAFWKYCYEPFIRRAAGLGKAPTAPDEDSYEHLYAFTDLLIIGGGIAGLMAAKYAGAAGMSVLLVEERAICGGRAFADGDKIEGKPAEIWIKNTLEYLEKKENITIRTRTSCAGVFDHGYALCTESLSDHHGGKKTRRQRLWRVRARKIITATGAIERPLSFPGNDKVGVFLASAVRDYLCDYGVAIGRKIAVITNNDDAYRTALALKAVGVEVCAIIDARAELSGDLPRMAEKEGIALFKGAAIAGVWGKRRVRGIKITRLDDKAHEIAKIACDGIAMSGGWSPSVHHWSHTGGKLLWDEEKVHFRPDMSTPQRNHDGEPALYAVGASAGDLTSQGALSGTQTTMQTLFAALGVAKNTAPPAPPASVDESDAIYEAPPLPVWVMPTNASYKMRQKIWIDFQNDVKATDIELAAREGYESVEHAKRYTTLGMATDQGKLSNINGLALLSHAINASIPATGTTTFRPPYTPVTLGTIAGEAHNDIFQPIRRTPLHAWHGAHGAYWEPVGGGWRRPYAYRQTGETLEQAIQRETLNVRENVGMLDASTLGKLIVKGPDAGQFMDMLYTNMMSTLGVGHCRYGVMCNENGFLIDDGVVARLKDGAFLCHTTTGGAETIHAHMERWLQTEWWDWQVWVQNVSEQFAQIGLAGPNARKLLEKLGVETISKESLPFMRFYDTKIGDIPARIFRISFSGELSYEIAVPATKGEALWEALYEAGQEFGIMAYGTEALHILRAEKGFIMIGNETDGTVIPQDLGLNWLISRKKQDYIGKRAQARKDMVRQDRWRLVGLETLDGSVLGDGAYAFLPTRNQNNQRDVVARVSSSYRSPTLGRGIALGLALPSCADSGAVLTFSDSEGKITEARVVSPIFYDPEGEKQNV